MLSQPGSARLLAMGGAGTALASGAEALWWNPAGLGRGDKLSAEMTLRKQWDETDLGYLGGIIVTPWGTPGLALTYSQTRGIIGYDEAGQETGNFATCDLESKLAYAFLVNPVYVGVAVNYLYQNFFTSQVKGFGSDLGAVWEFWNKCFVGISLLHLGRTWVGDWMPFEGRLGLGTTLIQGLQLATDLIVPRDSHAYFAAGAEWFPWDMLGFRLGIHNGPLDVGGLGDYALLTAGIGYRWEQLKIDYYFETNSEIGDAHHLALGYRTYVAPAKPNPVYQPVTGPREEVPEIRYAAQYVFTPNPLPKDYEARELEFKVQDKEGHVLKSMAFSDGNIPREITWDGKDDQGTFVALQALKFSFVYQTNRGVKTQVQEWPYTEPARKLYFPREGLGIEPGVHFSVSGKPNAVRQWQVQIVSERKGEEVYATGGQGSVPEHLFWDGKATDGTWADPGQKYTMRMLLKGPQGSVVIDRPVLPIYTVMLKSGSPHRVRFKIHKILFDGIVKSHAV